MKEKIIIYIQTYSGREKRQEKFEMDQESEKEREKEKQNCEEDFHLSSQQMF